MPDEIARQLDRVQRFVHIQGRLGTRPTVQWRDPSATGAGTIHIADSLDELTKTAAHLLHHRLRRAVRRTACLTGSAHVTSVTE